MIAFSVAEEFSFEDKMGAEGSKLGLIFGAERPKSMGLEHTLPPCASHETESAVHPHPRMISILNTRRCHN